MTTPAGKVCLCIGSCSCSGQQVQGRELLGTNGRRGFAVQADAGTGLIIGTWAYTAS